MLGLTIILEGDGAVPEMAGKEIIQLSNDAPPIIVTALAGGMVSGLPSVAFIFPLPDGRYVFAETSLRLFLSAADALKARYGDPRGLDFTQGGQD